MLIRSANYLGIIGYCFLSIVKLSGLEFIHEVLVLA